MSSHGGQNGGQIVQAHTILDSRSSVLNLTPIKCAFFLLVSYLFLCSGGWVVTCLQAEIIVTLE